MMDMKKTYLVSDLASELDVPRTTVNDWLRIYGDYLESDVRGKRKVYPERTLEILREIKAMREKDQAQGAIEQFLADKYGIRPEPVTDRPEPEAPAGIAPDAPEAAPAPEAPETTGSGALVRQDPELKELFQRMAEQEELRRSVARRAVRSMFLLTLVLLFALILTVLGIAYYFHGKLRDAEALAARRQQTADRAVSAAADSLAELRKTQEAAQVRAAEHARQLEKLSVTLDRTREDYRQETARLAREMDAQKQAADRALAEMRKSEEGRRAAELAELKRAFAAGQAELLKRIEEEKSARTQAEDALAELRRQNIQTNPAPQTDVPASGTAAPTNGENK